MPATETPLVVTVGQAAEALQLSVSMIRKLIRQGRLATVPYCGQRVRIARSELERFARGGAA